MFVRLPSIVAWTLAAAFAPSLHAQEATPELHKVGAQSGRVHYDLSTGTITKLVRPRRVTKFQISPEREGGVQRAATNSFNNTLSTGYFTTVPIGDEYIDWAVKDTGKSLMTAFRFAYGSLTPAADLDVSFYSGTNAGGGFCVLGSELLRASFVGLPGLTPTMGFGATFVVTSFLSTGIQVPDGPIGWGYAEKNGSEVGPLLTDFGTNTGWSDSFETYQSPASLNTCQGRFWFGGCSTGNVPPSGTGGNPCSSFFIGISEYAPSVSASCSVRNGGTNPVDLTLIAPPVVGGAFVAKTQRPFAAYFTTTASLPGIAVTGLLNGTLLCDPLTLFGGIRLTSQGDLFIAIPGRHLLGGQQVFVQAAERVAPGNFQLTNALDCVIGG